jgi:N-acetylneuraminic acid mutarotase
MGLVAYNGKLYAIAGRFTSSTNPTNLFEVYDPATDSWKELPPMPTARSGGLAAAFRDRILYMGGELRNGRNNGVYTDNEAFDPSGGTWTELAPMQSGRHGSGAAVVGDKIYVPGGGGKAGGGMITDTLQIFTLP